MPALYSVQQRSHTGCVREVNEDRVQTVLDWPEAPSDLHARLAERGHLFAVADGMGGHAAGDVASRIAMNTLFSAYYNESLPAGDEGLKQAIAAADQQIRQQVATDERLAGMGTTLVAALLHAGQVTIGNVGDSRAYLFREQLLQQITRDHSWVEEQVQAGVISREEALHHPYRNIITRSLGPNRNAEPDLFHVTVQPGDIFLLCTDGLSNELQDEELQRILNSYALDEAADNMLELALQRGAPDNVSFILFQLLGQTAPRRRRLWPLLLLLLTLLLVIVGLWSRRLLLPPAASTATPESLLLPLATPDPQPSPTPAIPSAQAIPIEVIELAAGTVDAGNRFGPLSAQSTLRGRPLRERYMLFVQGPLVEQNLNNQQWDLAIAHQGETVRRYRFSIDGDGARLAENSIVGVLGRPQHEEDLQGDSILEALMLVDATGRPLWTAGGDLKEWQANYGQPLWVYTVLGAGGGNALELDTPPGGEGQPVAVWGRWSFSEGDTLQFTRLDEHLYLWQDGMYKALANQ